MTVSAPHRLTVRTIEGEREYDLEHPIECTKVITHRYPHMAEPTTHVHYECLVQYDLENAGLHDWPDGVHIVEGYVEAIRGADWVEHDGGIRECEAGTFFTPRPSSS